MRLSIEIGISAKEIGISAKEIDISAKEMMIAIPEAIEKLDKEHEPRHEKNKQCGYRTDPTETDLYKHRIWLEAGNFGPRK